MDRITQTVRRGRDSETIGGEKPFCSLSPLLLVSLSWHVRHVPAGNLQPRAVLVPSRLPGAGRFVGWIQTQAFVVTAELHVTFGGAHRDAAETGL